MRYVYRIIQVFGVKNFMARSRFSIAKPDIEKFFNENDKRVYTPGELEKIFILNNKEWRLAKTSTLKSFVQFLLERSKMTRVPLDFPRPLNRYIWGPVTSDLIYEICLSLSPKAYLTHYTAMFLHNLTEQIPKNFYVTVEQTPKSRGTITQEDIDEAFQKPIRRTQNVASYLDCNITLLNGAATGNLGVVSLSGEFREKLQVTNIERTLIDIAVRPEYSGGVFEVLKAYERAKDHDVSVNTLKAYVKKINFVYPYHQVIGFYLERASYSEKRLNLFDMEEKIYDFYLMHDMKDVRYSNRWRLYYPRSLDG